MFNISFDFDAETSKVTNIKVTSTEVKASSSTMCDLVLEDNKLSLSKDAVTKLNAKVGDRIAINYWTIDNENTYPLISKADVFTDGSDGNKLTKSSTVSFRGQQRSLLSKYGTKFSFEQWEDKSGELKEGVFKLIPVKEEVSQENLDLEEKQLSDLNKGDIEDELANLLNEDDPNYLPF